MTIKHSCARKTFPKDYTQVDGNAQSVAGKADINTYSTFPPISNWVIGKT